MEAPPLSTFLRRCRIQKAGHRFSNSQRHDHASHMDGSALIFGKNYSAPRGFSHIERGAFSSLYLHPVSSVLIPRRKTTGYTVRVDGYENEKNQIHEIVDAFYTGVDRCGGGHVASGAVRRNFDFDGECGRSFKWNCDCDY
jgi:hypothetical protein